MGSDLTILKSCPFCGSDASIIESGDRFYVACQSLECYAALGEIWDRDAMPDHQFASAEEAADRWNQRSEYTETK